MAAPEVKETPEGYLARAKAVFKIDRTDTICDRAASLGEFLHRADVMGA